jgi:hypothetical protein
VVTGWFCSSCFDCWLCCLTVCLRGFTYYSYYVTIGGLVGEPRRLSLDDIRSVLWDVGGLGILQPCMLFWVAGHLFDGMPWLTSSVWMFDFLLSFLCRKLPKYNVTATLQVLFWIVGPMMLLWMDRQIALVWRDFG